MPKFFWLRSTFFEHVQIFLTKVKSDIFPYKFAYLTMVKNIWLHSKNIDCGQKKFERKQIFFELADGLGKTEEFMFQNVDYWPTVYRTGVGNI